MNALNSLPVDLARYRILPTKDAAAFLGVSEKTLRRMKDQRKIPDHIPVSDRKIGWRIGDLCEYQNARAAGWTWHEWKAAQVGNDNRRP